MPSKNQWYLASNMVQCILMQHIWRYVSANDTRTVKGKKKKKTWNYAIYYNFQYVNIVSFQ